jgi:predicted pyridoxine 5'-phosphate oxidase superfamily flavin-nucleotide-binding protein
MHESVTTMDQRYSDPEAIATGWEEMRRVLETAELFWLATVLADGRPHVTPVVAVWHDGPSTSAWATPNRRPGTCVATHT